MKAMYKNIYILPLLLALLLTACEKDANIKLPKQDPKLAVSGFISPQDTIIRVFVSLSVPLYEPDPGNGNPVVVSDAVVTISNGSVSKQLFFDQFEQNYQLDASLFAIEYGRTYELRISAPGNRYAEATCTVPATPAPSPSLIDHDSVTHPYRQYRYKIGFMDIPLQHNYYRALVTYYNYPNPADTSMKGFGNTYAETNPYWDDGSSLLDAGTMDGELIQIRFRDEGAMGGPAAGVVMKLISCDENYYRFHTSYSAYKDTEGNPFADPAFVFSNVKGGLGCFGAYTMVTKEAKL